MLSDLVAKLNPEQRRAVETTEGPLLVLAGAGTGKTRVITTRIAYLLERGVPPSSILAMTFTNKAAKEMRERIAALVGKRRAKQLNVGTFHAFCIKELRRHAEVLGFPRGFGIADSADQIAAVKGVLRDLCLSEDRMHPRALQSRISLLKNRLVSHDQAEEQAGGDDDDLVALVYKRYDQHLRRSRTLDFDDLLVEMVRLLEENPALLGTYRDRFRYLLVDEYQDTNGPQYQVVRSIAGGHRNLCVVGDDDQSIYAWRGADVQKILGFERDFPGCTVIRLETNYRSTNQILEVANRVIDNNTSRHGKELRSAYGDGESVRYMGLPDEEAEAEWIVREILSSVRMSHATYGDYAILFRAAMQARVLEARLRARQVPYKLVGGPSFFDRKEVRDVLAYLKLMLNPADEMSFLRVVNTPPRGVGKSTLDSVLEFATSQGVTVQAAFRRTSEMESPPREASVRSVHTFVDLLARLGAEDPGEHLVARLERVLEEVRYRDEIDRCYPDQLTRDARWAAVQEVLNFAENYVKRKGTESTLLGFLEELTLSANDDDTKEDKDQRNAVTLMTLHAAKGLEFPRVFLVGVEEGILPHLRSVKDDAVEEERRLMYVGITRAQRHLVVTNAESRAKFGRRVETSPSRFLFEMRGKETPDDWRAAGAPPREVPKRPRPGAPLPSRGGRPGQRRPGGSSSDGGRRSGGYRPGRTKGKKTKYKPPKFYRGPGRGRG